MSSIYQPEPKYSGNGGNAQIIFIKDAQVGWKNILDDLNRHLSNGASQYAYLESLLNRLGGQARLLLDIYLNKWDWLNEDNVYCEEATTREVASLLQGQSGSCCTPSLDCGNNSSTRSIKSSRRPCP